MSSQATVVATWSALGRGSCTEGRFCFAPAATTPHSRTKPTIQNAYASCALS
jgi:hypothetical protein